MSGRIIPTLTAVEVLGFRLVYGSATLDPDWPGLEAEVVRLRVALQERDARIEELRRMLGAIYAAYCIKTKPASEPMPAWFEEIIRELFPSTKVPV